MLRSMFRLFLVVLGMGSSSCYGEKIDEYLYKTNLDSSKFPWNHVANGKLKKWYGLIPVKSNGVKRAEEAMDRIEKKLGRKLFDRESIRDKPNNKISRGIIVSVGTAVGEGGTVDEDTCGHVGMKPGVTDYPKEFLKDSGEIDTVLYVNLGSARCDDSKRGRKPSDTAVHEFGHALGLGEHFPGFGDGEIISDTFWSVLSKIYKE